MYGRRQVVKESNILRKVDVPLQLEVDRWRWFIAMIIHLHTRTQSDIPPLVELKANKQPPAVYLTRTTVHVDW